MTRADIGVLVAAVAALVSALSALYGALRQGRLERRLIRLQQINVERREHRDSLTALGATSRVVAERGIELGACATERASVAEVRPKFEAFSAAAEYLVQAWAGFSSRITQSDFAEVRESVSRTLEAAEGVRLGWMVLASGGPSSSVEAMAGYAEAAAQWSGECQRMCAVGVRAAGAL